MKTFANIISVVLHPLLMPTLTYTVVAFMAPTVLLQLNPDYRLNFIWTIFCFTFLLPLTIIFFMYRLGLVGERKTGQSVFMRSMTLEDQKERFLPFFMTTVLYGSLSYMLFSKHILTILAVIFAGVTFCLAVVTIVSRYWKISAHSTGIAGVVGFLSGVYLKYGEQELFYPILVTLVLTGLLMSARLYLNQHSLTQVFAGGALGFSVCLGVVWFFG